MNASTVKSKWGDREVRRADLLLAARQQLALKGYAALNIRMVAQEAGLSPGSVYTYFANKEELFATLYAERLAELHVQVQPLCQKATSLEDLLLGFVHLYMPVYQGFGRDLNVWSMTRDENSHVSAELVAELARCSTRVLSTLFMAVQRLAVMEGIDLIGLENPQLFLSLLHVFVNGLADHFSGDRQLMAGATLDELTRFGARVLVAGLKQLVPAPHSAAFASTPPCP